MSLENLLDSHVDVYYLLDNILCLLSVLWSEAQQIMDFVQLTVPWEHTVEMASERKKSPCTEMAADT